MSVAIPYLDDTIIHSQDIETHFEALTLVLEAYKTAGLKLQPNKCSLFQTSMNYLGHTVNGEGIAPMKDNLMIVVTMRQDTRDMSCLA